LIPGSVSKWAMLMHVSRPSLHRELKRLEEQLLISYMPPVIDILDPDGLKKILDKIRDH
ncbi:winged helix-turn-helix domain-containing protein, partial [bacterium]|nr:winged helix-turn-helix domain-containing protein [bacterium]